MMMRKTKPYITLAGLITLEDPPVSVPEGLQKVVMMVGGIVPSLNRILSGLKMFVCAG